jgi:hypothetical protein
MDQITLYIIGGIIIIGFGAVIFFINKKITDLANGKDDSSSFLMLNQNIQGMQERIDKTTDYKQSTR